MGNDFKVKILLIGFVSHDTKRFIVEKPEGYDFSMGQHVMVSINKDGWVDKKRPFSFANSPDDGVLEFIIKCYPSHNGVTKELHNLNSGDELFIADPFGPPLHNKDDKGVFVIGRTGIGPVIALLRDLHNKGEMSKNVLFLFAEHLPEDIMLEKELRFMYEKSPDNLIILNESEVNLNVFKEHIVGKDLHEAHIYGPKSFVQPIKKMFREDLGFDKVEAMNIINE